MYNYKFSIVIPLYNTEKYCKECIESIVNQTYQNYELILVDDGSSDHTAEICRSFQEKYKNVDYIFQENKGQSVARNVGISKAKGKYILFIDSDDRLDNADVLSQIDNLLNGDQDLLFFGYRTINEGNDQHIYSTKQIFPQLKKIYHTGLELLDDIITKKPDFRWYPWQFVFKRETWNNNNLLFPNRRIGEDQAIIYKYFTYCGSCVVTEKEFYNYRVGNSSSITAHEKYEYWHDYLKVCVDMVKEIESSNAYTQNLKKKLLSCFSIGYYTVLIHATFIEKEKINCLLDELKTYQWLTKYSLQKKQVSARKIINLLGIKNTAYLLRLRRKIRT